MFGGGHAGYPILQQGAEAGAGVGAVILFRACSAPCARLASRSGSGNSSLIHGALSRCGSLASSLLCQLQSSPGPACQLERTARFAPSVQARLQVEIEQARAAEDGQPARRHGFGHGAATHMSAASTASPTHSGSARSGAVPRRARPRPTCSRVGLRSCAGTQPRMSGRPLLRRRWLATLPYLS